MNSIVMHIVHCFVQFHKNIHFGRNYLLLRFVIKHNIASNENNNGIYINVTNIADDKIDLLKRVIKKHTKKEIHNIYISNINTDVQEDLRRSDALFPDDDTPALVTIYTPKDDDQVHACDLRDRLRYRECPTSTQHY